MIDSRLSGFDFVLCCVGKAETAGLISFRTFQTTLAGSETLQRFRDSPETFVADQTYCQASRVGNMSPMMRTRSR